MRRMLGLRMLGVAILGASLAGCVGCGKEEPKEFQAGEELITVGNENGLFFLYEPSDRMSNLYAGTKVRYLGPSPKQEDYARIKVLEGESAELVGRVRNRELTRLPK